MKTLKNIISILISVVLGLIPAAGFILIGLLVLDRMGEDYGMVFFSILSLVGIILGLLVFNTVRRRGVLEFLTATSASPDLDNLELGQDSESMHLSVEEYVERCNSGKNLCPGGFVRIWGDYRSRQLDVYNQIRSVNLDEDGTLTIAFRNQNRLQLVNPGNIFESASFLKVLEASEIRWEWYDLDSDQKFFFHYLAEKNDIKARTNSDWVSDSLDTLAGKPAVFMHTQE